MTAALTHPCSASTASSEHDAIRLETQPGLLWLLIHPVRWCDISLQHDRRIGSEKVEHSAHPACREELMPLQRLEVAHRLVNVHARGVDQVLSDVAVAGQLEGSSSHSCGDS